jgi:hypothetical protein
MDDRVDADYSGRQRESTGGRSLRDSLRRTMSLTEEFTDEVKPQGRLQKCMDSISVYVACGSDATATEAHGSALHWRKALVLVGGIIAGLVYYLTTYASQVTHKENPNSALLCASCLAMSAHFSHVRS